MSSQTARQLTDVSRFVQVGEANIAMIIAMHGALSEIARCEVSLDGGIAQKHIAENALIAVNRIAQMLGERATQN